MLKDLAIIGIGALLALFFYFAVDIIYLLSKFFVVVFFLLYCYWYLKKDNYEKERIWMFVLNLYRSIKFLILRR